MDKSKTFELITKLNELAKKDQGPLGRIFGGAASLRCQEDAASVICSLFDADSSDVCVKRNDDGSLFFQYMPLAIAGRANSIPI